ncbi:hypothetical protein ACLS1A_002869 [Escherichia coli]
MTLGVLLALSGSVSGASLEVDNGQITNIDTDVAYDAYLVWSLLMSRTIMTAND